MTITLEVAWVEEPQTIFISLLKQAQLWQDDYKLKMLPAPPDASTRPLQWSIQLKDKYESLTIVLTVTLIQYSIKKFTIGKETYPRSEVPYVGIAVSSTENNQELVKECYLRLFKAMLELTPNTVFLKDNEQYVVIRRDGKFSGSQDYLKRPPNERLALETVVEDPIEFVEM
jgi:hypothetical protein